MKKLINFSAFFAVAILLLSLCPLKAEGQKKNKTFVADTGIVAINAGQRLLLSIANRGGNEPLAFCYQKIIWTFFDIDYTEFNTLKRTSATECTTGRFDRGESAILAIESSVPDAFHQVRIVFPTNTAEVNALILDVATKQFIDQFPVAICDESQCLEF